MFWRRGSQNNFFFVPPLEALSLARAWSGPRPWLAQARAWARERDRARARALARPGPEPGPPTASGCRLFGPAQMSYGCIFSDRGCPKWKTCSPSLIWASYFLHFRRLFGPGRHLFGPGCRSLGPSHRFFGPLLTGIVAYSDRESLTRTL